MPETAGRRASLWLSALLLAGGASSASAGSDIQSRQLIRRFNRESAERSFILPGWGQWHKGYRAKGAILASLEAVTLGGAYFTSRRARTLEEKFRRGSASYSAYTRRVDLSNYLYLSAALLWGYSAYDAYLSEPDFSRLKTEVAPGEIRLAYERRF